MRANPDTKRSAEEQAAVALREGVAAELAATEAIEGHLRAALALYLRYGGWGNGDPADWFHHLVREWHPVESPVARSTKARIPAKLRWEVFKEDDFRCCDCGSRDDLTADHIQPESQGGPTTLDNLRTLCRSCNSRKGTKPVDGATG